MGVVMNKLISIDNIIEYWKNIEFLGQAEIPAEKDIYNNKVNMDFSVNINPLGIPHSVKEAMSDALSYWK